MDCVTLTRKISKGGGDIHSVHVFDLNIVYKDILTDGSNVSYCKTIYIYISKFLVDEIQCLKIESLC